MQENYAILANFILPSEKLHREFHFVFIKVEIQDSGYNGGNGSSGRRSASASPA